MKKHLMMCAMAVALLSGCSKEQVQTNSEPDLGQAEFSCTSYAQVEEQTRAQVELPSSCKPAENQFTLRVTNTSGSYEKEYANLGAYDKPFMPIGTYTVTARYGDPTQEGPTAYAYAGSTDFTIVARKTIEASITATLVNSAIQLTTSEWFNNYYTDAQFTVTTSAGNKFNFSAAPSSLIFVEAGTTLKIKGTAVKAQNGVAVEFPEYEIGTTAKQTRHTIRIDASQVGGGSLEIRIDDTLIEVPAVEIELNPEA